MDNLEKAIRSLNVDFEENDYFAYFKFKTLSVCQGWKVHISVQLGDAMKVFGLVVPKLIKYNLNFKVIKNLDELSKINSPREQSSMANKFITIYPESDIESKKIMIELIYLLKDFNSPRILSDFQCGDFSPVHYRYGAFRKVQQYNSEENRLIYLIHDPQNNLVEDRRSNFPVLPSGIKDLFSKEEKEKYFRPFHELPSNSKLNSYQIEAILKKSNRGNVYRAIRKSDGQRMVIKQIRPFIFSDKVGNRSAVEDIKNEVNLLKIFSKKEYTAKFIDEFYVLQDYFAVQSFIEGDNFFEIVKKYPISVREAVVNQLVDIVDDIHQSGFKIVDLSPTNFLYSDGIVKLIDLENIVPIEEEARRVKTPFMVNLDSDLSISMIQQDYFSLCMVSFALFTGNVLSFEKGDDNIGISVIDKIKSMFYLQWELRNLTQKQFDWLIYLLDKSESQYTERIIPLNNFQEVSNLNDNRDLLDSVDFDSEFNQIKKYILNQHLNVNSRLLPTSEFGEFVSPLSFQHGLSGYLQVMTNDSNSDNKIVLKWNKEVNSLIHKSYMNDDSLLFGRAGYLWVIIDLYKKTSFKFYKNLALEVCSQLQANYMKVALWDFSLGKTGILLALIRCYSVTGDVTLSAFISKQVEKIVDFFVTNISSTSLRQDDYGFAHGFSGVAYMILLYSEIFNDTRYLSILDIFDELLIEVIENIQTDSESATSKLTLSWCRGLSGMILYLYLRNTEKYSEIISKAQFYIYSQHIHLENGFCHGLGSLLQTLNYCDLNNIRNNVLSILLSRSFRNENYLLLFSNNGEPKELFDFGTGSLGVYWCILGNLFPFDLMKEA